jgi:hypothetical protein
MLRLQYNKHHMNGHKYSDLQHHMDHQKGGGEQNTRGEELLIRYHDCCRVNLTQQLIRGEMG